VVRMAEQEATIRDQSQTIGTLTERLGHVTAELEALRAQNATLEAPAATEAPNPTTGGRSYVVCQADLASGVAGSW
jgi:hypothetical protein